MDKKLKAKWVKVLCSGQYKQARGALLDEAGHRCCLGVLGGILGIKPNALYATRHAIGGSDIKPLDECGLNLEEREALANLNDNGVPFEMIAGLINEAL